MYSLIETLKALRWLNVCVWRPPNAVNVNATNDCNMSGLYSYSNAVGFVAVHDLTLALPLTNMYYIKNKSHERGALLGK